MILSMTYTMFMPENIIADLVLTLQQNPTLSLIFVFLVAFSESLIVIGLIVPGALLMILFGALITMDALEFWPTVLFAVAGAIAGDSLSYWLGLRYQNRLLNLWPLSRHPEVIIKANDFFDKHGVKSIFLARFIGLLRPVIPAIAGITKMPVKAFIITNISSAVIWAPLYLIPGLLFGLSIEMASDFAQKFIFLIILLLALIILSLWIIQRVYTFAKPYNEKAINYLLSWGKKHSLAGEMPAAIFNKGHPEFRGLSFVAIIIFSFTVLTSILHSPSIQPYNPLFYDFESLNQLIYYRLQSFRSPPFDNIMLWLSYLASSKFIALLYLCLGSLFIIRKNFFTLWHWLAAIALPLLLSPLLSNDLTVLLQQNLNVNIQPLSFIVIVSSIGFLTVIISSELSFNKQKIIYYFSASLVIFLLLSQLYFANQVFSQVLFGLFVGLIWFNLLGVAYRRHLNVKNKGNLHKEMFIIIAVLFIYPSWKIVNKENIYLPAKHYFVMGANSWLESGWKILPISRHGIYQKKNDLFNLQWLGTKKNIKSQLTDLGYESSLNTTRTLSNWFLDGVKINQLPVLPHIHNGEYESLRFYRYNKDNKELTVIRLWQSKYKLRQNSPSQPLWFGSINFMEIKEKAGITYLITKNESIDKIKLGNKNLVIHTKFIFNEKGNKNNTVFLLQ